MQVIQVPSNAVRLVSLDGTLNMQQLGVLCSRALAVGTIEAARETLTRINRVLRGHGVSTIYRDLQDRTGVTLYVVRGNVLGTTVLYHLKLKKFYVSTLYEWKNPSEVQ